MQLVSRELRVAMEEAARRGIVVAPEAGATMPLVAYCPEIPHPTQNIFINLLCEEALFGGAASGGKSSALLMVALQYVHEPDYRCLILRRTYADLALPGAIMDRAKQWLLKKFDGVSWHDDTKTFTFPSGARISFGHMDNEGDKYRYQGSEFHCIIFDELTQFTDTQYSYMFSRLRRKADCTIPLRMRSGSNPGGTGHDWVKATFILNPNPNRVFVPSKITDNPSVDQPAYLRSLDHLDPVTKAQLLAGDWDVLPVGDLFLKEFFAGKTLMYLPPEDTHGPYLYVRAWDTAATKPNDTNKDPDYTVGLLMAVSKKTRTYYIIDVVRFREGPGEVERMIQATAVADGKNVEQVFAEERGSGGKIASAALIRLIPGLPSQSRKETGEKFIRAKPIAGQAQLGNVYIIEGGWNMAFLREICAFTMDSKIHDDQVDAMSLASAVLMEYVKPHTEAAQIIHGDMTKALDDIVQIKSGNDSHIISIGGTVITIKPDRLRKSGRRNNPWD